MLFYMASAAETSENTLTETPRASIQIRIPKAIWGRMKIQSIREGMTNEQLAAKAFEKYLASVEAQSSEKSSAA